MRPSPISTHTADATIGFVAENTQKRVSLVASPKVSKHTNSLSRATASWQDGVTSRSTSARAPARTSSMLTSRVSYPAPATVQRGPGIACERGRLGDDLRAGDRRRDDGARDRDVRVDAVGQPLRASRRAGNARRHPALAVDLATGGPAR